MARDLSSDSLPMLALLAMGSYAATMMTHEALGHGLYCMADGGHTTVLTLWRESCTVSGGRGIKVAGPAVQLAGALLAWSVLRRLPVRASRPRFALWLYMSFGLLIASGYLAFSAATMIGDAAEAVAESREPLLWRACFFGLGAVAYAVSIRVAGSELLSLCDGDRSVLRRRRIVWVTYLATGCFACGVAALRSTTNDASALGLAAASSFGALSGLFGVLGMRHGRGSATDMPPLRWSILWCVAALLVLGACAALGGGGLRGSDGEGVVARR